MRKNVLVYGGLSGALVAAFMLASMNFLSYCDGQIDYGTSMLIGYASMLAAFSLVFVGVKNYRDRLGGGTVSFGKAFKMGLLMVLIASTCYVAAWLIDYFFFMPGFMDKYAAHALENLRASGAGAAEIDRQARELAQMAILYRNPFFAALFTYAEILPVGIVAALVSALILKRKNRKPEGLALAAA